MEFGTTAVRIDQSTLREILARTDIGAFIGTYVQLRKRGNDFVGLCPFHGEKTPSFHVHPDRGFFKCFGCGAGGDVIKFVQQLENLSFPEAARVLARRAGIELEAESPAAARVRSEKDQIYAANDLAAAFFHRSLRMDAAGEAARAYVASRSLNPATVESFKLGFAPPGWSGLVDELRNNGVELSIAVKAGLLKARESGGFYDFYRNRLMIPTYATTGEVVAFGGRALDDSEPKYLNTSPRRQCIRKAAVFTPSTSRGRAAATVDALIVVEGYLDCIALHQAGFTNAVASLGTAFTRRTSRGTAQVRRTHFPVLRCRRGGKHRNGEVHRRPQNCRLHVVRRAASAGRRSRHVHEGPRRERLPRTPRCGHPAPCNTRSTFASRRSFANVLPPSRARLRSGCARARAAARGVGPLDRLHRQRPRPRRQ